MPVHFATVSAMPFMNNNYGFSIEDDNPRGKQIDGFSIEDVNPTGEQNYGFSLEEVVAKCLQ
jgi:hypothetical protein